MRPVFSLLLLAVASLSACESCAPPAPELQACTLPDGSSLAPGESQAVDECNVCLCRLSLELDCTSRACNPDQDPHGEGEGEGEGPAEGEGEPQDTGPCQDQDEDGYFTCVDENFPARPTEIDCDDLRFHVQPLGIEFADTPEDDNCNGAFDDWAHCECPASAEEGADSFAAMDLCGAELVDTTRSGGAIQFGVTDKYQGEIDGTLRVLSVPGELPIVIGNDCLATLSTGDALAPVVDASPGDCSNDDPDPSGAQGDALICDLAILDADLHVPPNASGFAFDFMFLSYEWPEYLCQVYNDTFYATVQTMAVRDGVPTNAAFDSAGRPITVNVGFFENATDWTVSLENTSQGADVGGACTPEVLAAEGCTLPSYCGDGTLDARNGSGSGWLTTRVPVIPGEEHVHLRLSIHDESDQSLDSLVILDSFRWLPFETELETAKEER